MTHYVEYAWIYPLHWPRNDGYDNNDPGFSWRSSIFGLLPMYKRKLRIKLVRIPCYTYWEKMIKITAIHGAPKIEFSFLTSNTVGYFLRQCSLCYRNALSNYYLSDNIWNIHIFRNLLYGSLLENNPEQKRIRSPINNTIKKFFVVNRILHI